MILVILDSFAWIEFFNGTEKGKKVEEKLTETMCYTSLIALAEISEFCARSNKDFNKFFEKIISVSTILPIDQEISILAGSVNFHRKKKVRDWGMMDSILLSTALIFNLKILTGDKHFEDLPNVEMI